MLPHAALELLTDCTALLQMQKEHTTITKHIKKNQWEIVKARGAHRTRSNMNRYLDHKLTQRGVMQVNISRVEKVLPVIREACCRGFGERASYEGVLL